MKDVAVIDQASMPKLLNSVWLTITNPHPSVTGANERRQARFAASIIIIIAPLFFFAVLSSLTINFLSTDDLFALTAFLICYPLSRSRYWRWASFSIIATLWTAPLFAVLANTLQFATGELNIIMWYFPAVVIIFLLFSFRVTVIALLLSWGVALAVYIASPALTTRYVVTVSILYWGLLLVLATFEVIQRASARERQAATVAENRQRQLAEALIRTGVVLSSTLDLDKVLDLILEQVATIVPSSASDIMLIENGIVRVVRARGYDVRGTEQATLDLRLPINQVPNFRYMLETGKPLLINDTDQYPEWVDIETSRWIKSELGAPIRLQGETIGFLNVCDVNQNAFTEVQTQHLVAFAAQAAIAIGNARLYAETRRYVGDLEAEVNERAAQLHLMHGRLRAILDSTGEGIYYSEGTQVQYANAAMAAMTGYSQDEMIGMSSEVLRDASMSVDELQQLRAVPVMIWKHGVWRGEARLRRKDGSTFYAGLTVSPVGNHEQAALRTVTVVRDISRDKELDLQKANFVAHASHELRTPITNLKTRLYLLRKRPEFLEDHLTVLEEVTERMKKLVEDLLDRTRLERGQIPLRFETTTIQTVITRVVAVQKMEAEKKKLRFGVEMPDIPINISMDSERIVQVLTNLLTNAINYTPAGGSIMLKVNQTNSRITITIEDSGVGIALDHLPHIFEPFYRIVSEVDGTGLGLSIARQIIERHGGEIQVTSEIGKGSCFSVILQVSPEPTTDPATR